MDNSVETWPYPDPTCEKEQGDTTGIPLEFATFDKQNDHGGSAASKLRCSLCRTVSLCRS